MSTDTWQFAGASNWTVASDWSTGAQPGRDDDAVIDEGAPAVTSNIVAVNSIFVGDAGALTFNDGDVNVVGNLSVYGKTDVDVGAGQNSSSINVGGYADLQGNLDIGNATETKSVYVFSEGLSLGDASNPGASKLVLIGNTAAGTTDQTTFYDYADTDLFDGEGVNSPDAIFGNISLTGDALLEFASGGFTTIAAGASLYINGPQARVALASDTTTNSALTTLDEIDGSLDLEGVGTFDFDSSLNIYGSTNVFGQMYVDTDANAHGSFVEMPSLTLDGGSLTVGSSQLESASEVKVDGSLVMTDVTNGNVYSGASLSVFGSMSGSAPRATLSIGSQAGFGTAGQLASFVDLYGNALLEFQGGGQITSISGSLDIIGPYAHFSDATAPGSNSALTGLNQITSSGLLVIGDNALAVAGNLDLAGLFYVDTPVYSAHGYVADSATGSKVSIGGTLTLESGAFLQAGLSSRHTPTAISVGGLYNSGTIRLYSDTSHLVSLVSKSAAGFGTAGTLSGEVDLDGDAMIAFASGAITTIASGATLSLDGAGARIASGTATTSNSALTHLASNAGTFDFTDGTFATAAGAALRNTGTLSISNQTAATSLSIGGALTNSGTLMVTTKASFAPAQVSVASLTNTGTITLTGSSLAGGSLATLSILQGGTNSGTITLSGPDAVLKTGGSFVDTGTLTLSGGTVEVAGGTFDETTSVASTGRFLVDAGATLEFSNYEDNPIVLFNGQNSTLKLDDSYTQVDASNFGLTDVVDLTSVSDLVSLDYDGSYVDLTYASGGETGSTLVAAAAITGLAAHDDGAGGTDLVAIQNTYALTTGTDLVTTYTGVNTIGATAATLNAGDTLSGNGTSDTLVLSGGGTFDFTKLAGFTGFETIKLAAGANYTLIMADSDVAAGGRMTIDASALGAGNTLTFNGAAEKNGAFTITGGAGNDSITGSSGADIINGGGGADTMSGGNGNDTYYVDNASDKIIETATGGIDTVHSTVSYSIAGQYIENFVLDGTAAINATGNLLANTITGNSAANIVNGGLGADTMIGGAGNDTYYVDNVGDKIVETATGGTDTVHSTISYSLAGQYLENLILDGTAAINATGNILTNVITGNSAANVITGGGGADKLTGGAGADTFVYTAGFGKDTITDFSAGDTTGHDLLQFASTLFTSYSNVMAHASQSGSDTLITYDANDTITLTGVQKTALTSADFKFTTSA